MKKNISILIVNFCCFFACSIYLYIKDAIRASVHTLQTEKGLPWKTGFIIAEAAYPSYPKSSVALNKKYLQILNRRWELKTSNAREVNVWRGGTGHIVGGDRWFLREV